MIVTYKALDEIASGHSLNSQYALEIKCMSYLPNISFDGSQNFTPEDSETIVNSVKKTRKFKTIPLDYSESENVLEFLASANYGGQWDIVQAARQFAQACAKGEYAPEDLTEELLGSYISLSELPKPDLCIRTAGEQRISNFLIWQMAYSEYYFSDLLWPDFDKFALGRAIESYATRERRFGKTSEQLEADNA